MNETRVKICAFTRFRMSTGTVSYGIDITSNNIVPGGPRLKTFIRQNDIFAVYVFIIDSVFVHFIHNNTTVSCNIHNKMLYVGLFLFLCICGCYTNCFSVHI